MTNKQIRQLIASPTQVLVADGVDPESNLGYYGLSSIGKALLGVTTTSQGQEALSLVPGTDVQPYDSDLAALAGLTTTGLIDRTGAGTATTRTTGTTGLNVLAAADEAEARAAINAAATSHTQDWSTITNRPTNLSGYGITDAQPLDSDLTALASLTATGLIDRTGAGTAVTRTTGATGLAVLAAANEAAARTALAVPPINNPRFTGNVGIDTSSPGAKLDVSGGDALIHGVRVGRGGGNISTNTAVGASAFAANTTGNFNSAIGFQALPNNTTGSGNTAIGFHALVNNTTGTNNTAIGFSTFYNIGTGSGNIGIGETNSAGVHAPVFSVSTQNNRIVMGHTSVTNAYVQVAWTVVSDARDKTQIEPLDLGLDFVEKLNPVSFKFRVSRDSEQTNGGKHYGFLAQEVLTIEGENPVIVDTEDPEKLKMTSEELIPILVNAIQELKAEFDAYKASHP